MAAIVPKAVAALLLITGVMSADTHADIVDLFASMTAALSEDNTPGFMRAFDKKLPGYDELNRQIKSMVLASEVASSIEILKDEGDAHKRDVDLDWYLELKGREPNAPTVRKRQIVHCQLALQNKRWRIVALDPVSFFYSTATTSTPKDASSEGRLSKGNRVLAGGVPLL